LEDMVVAAVQMNALLGETSANLKAITGWTRKAARAKADLVLFPELAITGHWCSGDAWKASQEVPGPAVKEIEDLARKHNLYISVGIGERDAGIQYNTQILAGPSGFIGKQRKLHMSSDEYFYYRGGSEMPVLDAGKCRVGTVICYDNLFPEIPRILALKGAEVVLSPHASRFAKRWKNKGQSRVVAHQKSFYRKVYVSRAYDNGVYYVITNQAGKAGKETNHAGGIMIFDPQGEVVAESETKIIEDEMVVANLEASKYEERRSGRCFNLVTRRPRLFGEISLPTS
jgi:predicted amidohydrolase